jgi:hypothetical protein
VKPSRALAMIHDWRPCVADLLPSLHGHQAKALADHVDAHVPTPTKSASARRRYERLLDNNRLRPRLAQRDLSRALLAPWARLTIRT